MIKTEEQPSWAEIDLSTDRGLRELDKLIAQRLSEAPLIFVEAGSQIRYHRLVNDSLDSTAWYVLPEYSTDANHALRLIDRLPRGIEFLLIKRSKSVYSAKITIRYRDEDIFAKGSTPALAICRAWLVFADIDERGRV